MSVPADNRKHVLVVEDDPKIADLLLDYLRAAGLTARGIANGAQALRDIEADAPSLILLDLNLPGLDGVEVCRAVRRFADLPIIMLTARIDEVDRLTGLEIGADDYVVKPFSPREVIARVRAQLRRAEGRLKASTSPWAVDEERLQISWCGAPLPLTVLEFRLLRLMLGQPGRVFSRAQLLDHVHDEPLASSDRAIDSHIKNLRRKLREVDRRCNRISSVYGAGYRLDEANDEA